MPRSLLTQDVPEDKHYDLDFIVDLVTGRRTSIPSSRTTTIWSRFQWRIRCSEGYIDKWIVYGLINGQQRFSARELTVMPGASCTIHDPGASGVIVTQGHGRIGKLEVDCPSLIRFGEMTQDEVFISHEAALEGVAIENHSKTDPLVTLRYFGPDVHSNMPGVGDHRR